MEQKGISSGRKSVCGTQEVSPYSAKIYLIESIAVAATPGIIDPGTPEDFAQFLLNGGVAHAYIENDQVGTSVGYIALSELADSQYMEVRSLAVLPEHQRKGYGQKMMLAAEVIAAEAGRSKMILATSPENTGAVQFYQALGYVVIKEVADYYGDGTSRYILEKQLRS